MLTTAPRGTQDLLPEVVAKYQYVERVFRDLCARFGFDEVRTPMFEHTELFIRGVGEASDIVRKEMYTFTDRGDRSITLRAEGTAPAVRAFVEHGLYAQTQPTKLYYIAQIFRYEKPQAGRFRQHQQCGVEVFGTPSPMADVEVIALADSFYEALGLKNYHLEINSVGCPTCRPRHREALLSFLGDVKAELCADCQDRLERNPMRVLDCKNPHCQELTASAPTTADTICPECRAHHETVLAGLDRLGIAYTQNPRLVRGLDYYTNTAFEFISDDVGAQSAIGGGGRYNGLIAELGGPEMPGVGFGLGTERIVLALENAGIKLPLPAHRLDAVVIRAGEEPEVVSTAQILLYVLRRAGLRADSDTLGRSLKNQLKWAGKINAANAIIIGKSELDRGIAVVRDLAAGTQQEVSLSELEQGKLTV